MLYLPQLWLQTALGFARDADLGFRTTLTDDPHFSAAIRRACAALHARADRLTRDAVLDEVLYLIRAHLGLRVAADAIGAPALARRARERLLNDLAEDISADALAREAGASDRFQLARAFRTAYGTSPHSYLVQMRITSRLLRFRGQTVVPPKSVMNSRRLISFTGHRTTAYHTGLKLLCITAELAVRRPLGVRSRHRSTSSLCLLYPRKRTQRARRTTSYSVAPSSLSVANAATV